MDIIYHHFILQEGVYINFNIIFYILITYDQSLYILYIYRTRIKDSLPVYT